MSTFTNPHERIEELQMRVEALEGALRVEIEAINERDRGSSHWEGCHHEHPKCAARRRMLAALDSSPETPSEPLSKYGCIMGCGKTFCSLEGRAHHEELCRGPTLNRGAEHE